MAHSTIAFGSPWKFGSYIDLFFVDRARQLDVAAHEQFANALKTLLGKVPDFAAAADIVLRRCYYHRPEYSPDHSDDGYCLTFYLNGYGDDEDGAKKSWAIGLKLVQNAVMQLIVGEAGTLAMAGIAAGVACSLVATILMRKLLFGVRPWDLPTFVVVAVALAFCALLASYIPARRAAKLDPMVALRYE